MLRLENIFGQGNVAADLRPADTVLGQHDVDDVAFVGVFVQQAGNLNHAVALLLQVLWQG